MATRTPLTDIEKSVGVSVIAELLDCSEDSVHRYVKTQGLPCVQMCNRSRRFLVSEVLKWRDRRKVSYPATGAVEVPAPTKGRPGRPSSSQPAAWDERLKEIRKGKP